MENYDVWARILQEYGEKYMFQNILVCKDFYKIIKKLKYETKCILTDDFNDIIFSGSISYFLFMFRNVNVDNLGKDSSLFKYMFSNAVHRNNFDIVEFLSKSKTGAINKRYMENYIIVNKRNFGSLYEESLRHPSTEYHIMLRMTLKEFLKKANIMHKIILEHS